MGFLSSLFSSRSHRYPTPKQTKNLSNAKYLALRDAELKRVAMQKKADAEKLRRAALKKKVDAAKLAHRRAWEAREREKKVVRERERRGR
ncbi:MAG: hypothetical protein HETSPECPRED_009650 [Heterodermia speciosa]|uniref:Uncharacterized protein n=1 Tax=Heterodermia speciosa TaxID=116794 RepID=A0A8H3EP45_9LECA|nr:MAG: hypothetical protein HETSPECPRED_009650 [Heterodermia speciosa]